MATVATSRWPPKRSSNSSNVREPPTRMPSRESLRPSIGQRSKGRGFCGVRPRCRCFIRLPTTTLMSLESCGLAVGRAHWTSDTSKAATLGLGSDGDLAVLVTRSGQLAFEWSLSGRRDDTGTLDFALELPPCPSSLLILDLPRDLTPLRHAEALPLPSTPSRRSIGELGVSNWGAIAGSRCVWSERSPRPNLVPCPQVRAVADLRLLAPRRRGPSRVAVGNKSTTASPNWPDAGRSVATGNRPVWRTAGRLVDRR